MWKCRSKTGRHTRKAPLAGQECWVPGRLGVSYSRAQAPAWACTTPKLRFAIVVPSAAEFNRSSNNCGCGGGCPLRADRRRWAPHSKIIRSAGCLSRHSWAERCPRYAAGRLAYRTRQNSTEARKGREAADNCCFAPFASFCSKGVRARAEIASALDFNKQTGWGGLMIVCRVE